jgi:hypothetical protein
VLKVGIGRGTDYINCYTNRVGNLEGIEITAVTARGENALGVMRWRVDMLHVTLPNPEIEGKVIREFNSPQITIYQHHRKLRLRLLAVIGKENDLRGPKGVRIHVINVACSAERESALCIKASPFIL